MKLLKTFSLFLGMLWTSTLLFAADEGDNIASIHVLGNIAVSSEVVLSQIQTKVGESFLKEVINDDLRRVYSLGYFSDVAVEVDDAEGGVAITFVIEEKYAIGSIDVVGNKVFRKSLLLRELELSEGHIFSKKTLSESVKKLLGLYEDKGYNKVKIDPQVTSDAFARRVNIVLMITEEQRVIVNKIEFLGNVGIATKTLKKQMKVKEKWLLGGGVLRVEELDQDLAKLKSFYKFKGYMNVRIAKPRLIYNTEGKGLTIQIEIKEGSLYKVGILEIQGNQLFATVEIEESLQMKEGKLFSQLGLLQDQRAIQDYFADRGYVYARVKPTTYINDEVGKVDVTYHVQENELAYVEKIIIQGNIHTQDKVIRRELKIHPLEPFDGQKIKRSRERLYNLNYFEEVSFETAEGSDPKMRDLIINVKEKKTGEFSFGGGYSSIDRLVGFIEIAQNNFDIRGFPSFIGAGQRMYVRAEIGGVRKNYSLGFTEPWLFDYPLLFGFDLFSREWDRDGYNEGRRGGAIRLGHPFGEDNYLLGSLKHEKIDIRINNVAKVPNQIIGEKGEKTLNSLLFKFSRDTRDNTQFAKNGALYLATIEPSGGVLGGDIDMVRYTFSTNYFWETKKNWVLDTHFRIGSLDGYNDTKVTPFYERFYAGGGSTIRGYEDRAVGPSEGFEPVGGNSMLILNAEYSFPLMDFLRGAVFIDAGNVWSGSNDWDLGDLKRGVGFGVRFKTPLGPIKLDYGFALEEAPHEDDRRLHFSMGGFF